MRIFTESERKAAQLARKQRRQDAIIATQHHKLDWMDENWWLSLAKQRGIRLPPIYHPATARGLKRWAKRLSKTPFSEHFGCSPTKLIALNPRTPLRAFVGQMLEP